MTSSEQEDSMQKKYLEAGEIVSTHGRILTSPCTVSYTHLTLPTKLEV